jgi:hypothetical protein
MSSSILATLLKNKLYWIDNTYHFQYDLSILDGSYLISIIKDYGFNVLATILNYHYIEGRMNLLEHYLTRSANDMKTIQGLLSGYTYQCAENHLNKYSPVLLYCIKFHPEHIPFILDEMKTIVYNGSFWDYQTRQLCFKKKAFTDIMDIVYGTLLELISNNSLDSECELACLMLLKECLAEDSYYYNDRYVLFMKLAHKKSLTRFIAFGKEYLRGSPNLSYSHKAELKFMN